MARLTTDLSARLWSGGICTRWMTIRGFANSPSVPPLPSFSERDALFLRLFGGIEILRQLSSLELPLPTKIYAAWQRKRPGFREARNRFNPRPNYCLDVDPIYQQPSGYR